MISALILLAASLHQPVAAARVAAVRQHGVVRLARPHADELEAARPPVAPRLGRLEAGVGDEHDARARGRRETAFARERERGQNVALAAVRVRDHHQVGSAGRHASGSAEESVVSGARARSRLSFSTEAVK